MVDQEVLHLHAALAEALQERDALRINLESVLLREGSRAERAEAALAEAREIIPALVREIDADGLRGHYTAELLSLKTKARAFLESIK